MLLFIATLDIIIVVQFIFIVCLSITQAYPNPYDVELWIFNQVYTYPVCHTMSCTADILTRYVADKNIVEVVFDFIYCRTEARRRYQDVLVDLCGYYVECGHFDPWGIHRPGIPIWIKFKAKNWKNVNGAWDDQLRIGRKRTLSVVKRPRKFV